MRHEATIDFNTDYTYIVTPSLKFGAHYDLIKWLNDFDSDGTYSVGGFGVYFSNADDATAFALRWA